MRRLAHRRRGMIMMLVLLLVAILLIVALAVIAGSNSAAQSATAVSIKYRVLNAAEGGENQALDGLVRDPTAPDGTHISGTLNGEQWDAWIRKNNLQMNPKQLPGYSMYQDPATGKNVPVPYGSAYLYGVASDNGGRTTYVESIVEPTPPLPMPAGALNAGNNVDDEGPMAIIADPGDVSRTDAKVSALNDIFSDQAPPPTVQGDTFAGGDTNQLPGANDPPPTHVPNAVMLPTQQQVAEAVRTAGLIAQSGTVLTPDQLEQPGPHMFTGNVYVNGDVTLASTSVTFQQGTYVYVNGNLCIQGGALLNDFNSAQNELVVNGDVSVENGGMYATTPGQNTLMLVLGADGATTPCNNVHAVDMTLTGGPTPVGTIFAANGSIDLTGGGSVSGAFDAARDLILGGTNANIGVQYDVQQATTALNTGTLAFQSYVEY